MIKLVSISKTYRRKRVEFRALNEVCLTIDSGEMIAITGPSGSGKTTLLNIIGGISKQSSGEYYFCDKEVKYIESDMAKFRQSNIGYILQNYSLINNRDVFYNISLPLRYKGVDKSQIRKKVLSLATSLGIYDKLSQLPHYLSGGEAQRVSIARAIISEPKIIIADEPTSSLDDDNKREVIAILSELNRQGITVVIATHDSSVSKICNRDIVIKDGNVLSGLREQEWLAP